MKRILAFTMIALSMVSTNNAMDRQPKKSKPTPPCKMVRLYAEKQQQLIDMIKQKPPTYHIPGSAYLDKVQGLLNHVTYHENFNTKIADRIITTACSFPNQQVVNLVLANQPIRCYMSKNSIFQIFKIGINDREFIRSLLSNELLHKHIDLSVFMKFINCALTQKSWSIIDVVCNRHITHMLGIEPIEIASKIVTCVASHIKSEADTYMKSYLFGLLNETKFLDLVPLDTLQTIASTNNEIRREMYSYIDEKQRPEESSSYDNSNSYDDGWPVEWHCNHMSQVD